MLSPQRLDVLMKQERYRAALELAQSFYDGSAKALVGLPANSRERKQAIAEKVLPAQLQLKIEYSTTRYFSDDGNTLKVC